MRISKTGFYLINLTAFELKLSNLYMMLQKSLCLLSEMQFYNILCFFP